MYRLTAKSISTGKTHASKWYPSIQEMTDLKKKLHENEDMTDVAVENDSEDSVTTKIGEIEEMANEMIAASADDDSFFTAEEKTMIDNLHEAIQAVYDSVMDRAEIEGEVGENADIKEAAGDTVSLKKIDVLETGASFKRLSEASYQLLKRVSSVYHAVDGVHNSVKSASQVHGDIAGIMTKSKTPTAEIPFGKAAEYGRELAKVITNYNTGVSGVKEISDQFKLLSEALTDLDKTQVAVNTAVRKHTGA